METIIDWFTELKKQYPEQANMIDKIIAGINVHGFNSEFFDNWIKSELKEIETTFLNEL